MKLTDTLFQLKAGSKATTFIAGAILCGSMALAQTPNNAVIDAIMKEGTRNSQLEKLGLELMDGVGPRLVGTPQMKNAHDWAVAKYASWGISARNEQWGTWRGWERGVSHIDMLSPRVKSLEGMQLAWSPGMGNRTETAQVVILPNVTDSVAFKKWLPTVKGKFVMISVCQPTGRDENNLKTFALPSTYKKIKDGRDSLVQAWANNIRRTGLTNRTLPLALENAGALA